jgi:hypothetical protein
MNKLALLKVVKLAVLLGFRSSHSLFEACFQSIFARRAICGPADNHSGVLTTDNGEATLRKAIEQRGVEHKNAIIRRSIASVRGRPCRIDSQNRFAYCVQLSTV